MFFFIHSSIICMINKYAFIYNTLLYRWIKIILEYVFIKTCSETKQRSVSEWNKSGKYVIC